MSNLQLIFDTARQTLEVEVAALQALQGTIDNDFCHLVEQLASSTGRLVVTGVGKSALVGQKIAATLNSTGTPSLFMHAADAIHGDLGMIMPGDWVLCLSKSGETPEMRALAPLLKQLGHRFIAVVASADCYLAKHADYTLLTPITTEADPHNLAPTASTVSQMALGDAIATSLSALRGFGPQEFARFHPGGSLGRQLLLTLGELASNNERPRVLAEASLQDVIVEMTGKRLGATAVVDEDGKLIGLITDGDLRRALGKGLEVIRLSAKQLMTPQPKSLPATHLATVGLALIEKFGFNHILLTDQEGRYAGMVHLHDFVREGMK